jgi:hypothetical protein
MKQFVLLGIPIVAVSACVQQATPPPPAPVAATLRGRLGRQHDHGLRWKLR